MEISYYLINPTGNITALVYTEVQHGTYAQINGEILKREPECEQVGFYSEDGSGNVSLRMSGGEFCGNAAMSAAALSAFLNGTGKKRLDIEVSGAAEKVPCEAVKNEEVFDCSVVMPSLKRRDIIETVLQGRKAKLPVLSFEGISHAVAGYSVGRGAAETVIEDLCRRLGAQAMGLMLFDRVRNKVKPLVYVDGISTLFWENSCASGTCALAEYLQLEKGSKTAFSEPGGIITAERTAEGKIKLYGRVQIIKKDSFFLDR